MDEENGFVLVHHGNDSGATARTTVEMDAPEYLDDISSFVDGIADDLWLVNKKIHDNPELCFEEFIAHKALTRYMEAQAGWKVIRSAYGMETAWVAVFDTGRKGPVVSFNVEMGMYSTIPSASPTSNLQ